MKNSKIHRTLLAHKQLIDTLLSVTTSPCQQQQQKIMLIMCYCISKPFMILLHCTANIEPFPIKCMGFGNAVAHQPPQ